jgi:hypothetical protein
MTWLYSTKVNNKPYLLSKSCTFRYIKNISTIATFGTFSKSSLINLDLNPKNLYPLHNTLDKNDVNYKFLDEYIAYSKNYDWTFHLKNVIKKLKNDLIYSFAILGYSKKNRSYITYGPHILITNKIII